MIHLPVLRWGQPYTSMEVDDVVHFSTGEPIAKVSRANGGLIGRDMRKAHRAREVLREIPIDDLIARVGAAGELYMNATLPMGDGTQSPGRVRAGAVGQHRPARADVPREHEEERLRARRDAAHPHVADARALVRRALVGLRRRARRADQLPGAESRCSAWCCRRTRPACTRSGCRSSRCRSASCSSPDRRSRGRRTAWRRRSSRPASRARRSRSIPAAATSAPPCSITASAALIFGGTATVDRYRGNAKVQAHGPGFSKILLGDDEVDNWEKYLDLMVESVYANSGRGCINCSGIWASRHTREIADALAKRLAAVRPLKPDNPEASLAAFTVPGAADAISAAIDAEPAGRRASPTSPRSSARARASSRTACADYLLPTVVHCASPEAAIAKKEYMFPFVTVVECPEAKMVEAIGPTLVCTRHHQQARAAAPADRRRAHRSPEPRPGADDSAQLAPAARRQHRRVPVPRPRVPDRLNRGDAD